MRRGLLSSLKYCTTTALAGSPERIFDAQFSGGRFTGMETPEPNWAQHYPGKLIDYKHDSAMGRN
jgi:hypothetical protein